MKLLLIFLTLSIGLCSRAQAWHVTLGAYKMLEKTQDKNGKHATNPFSPTIGLGANFRAFWGLGFSPQLGYTRHTNNTDDSYGGDYSVTTIMMLYDFLWVPGDASEGSRVPFAVRFGIGNFHKSIRGEGGRVTVPNGNSTATAYRPGGTSTSYTGTFNLGADFTFPVLQDWVQDFGIRFETFTFSPLNSEKRTYAFSLQAVGYF